jgi:hypothetical protein
MIFKENVRLSGILKVDVVDAFDNQDNYLYMWVEKYEGFYRACALGYRSPWFKTFIEASDALAVVAVVRRLDEANR